MSKHQGGHSMTTQTSPARRKRQAKRRRKEEAEWREKAGPLTVKFDPSIRKDEPSEN
jgi:hypothetical protein